MSHQFTRSALGPVAALCAALLLGACAVSLDVSGGASLSTRPSGGGEGRVAVGAEIGSEDFRFHGKLLGGGGYLDPLEGFGLFGLGFGFSGGDELRFDIGLEHTIRFPGVRPTRQATGIVGTLLFEILDLGGEDSALYLGPRLSAEYLWDREGAGAAGIFTLSIDLRFTFFDTTSGPITFGH